MIVSQSVFVISFKWNQNAENMDYVFKCLVAYKIDLSGNIVTRFACVCPYVRVYFVPWHLHHTYSLYESTDCVPFHINKQI